MTIPRYALMTALLPALLACGGKSDDAGSDDGAVAGGDANAAAAPAGGGAIEGTVRFTGNAPANPAIDMSEEEACAKQYTGQPTDSVVIVHDGKLQDVVVYVKSGLPAGQKWAVPAQAVVVDQKGCQYHPKNLAMMAGQKFEIRNSDPVLHNIKAVPTKNRGFNISQPSAGMKTERTFTAEEMGLPLQCNVHSWMHANVSVLPHPFSAVSGDDGTFRITGLPAGTYELEAHHVRLGTRTMSVTVPETGSATADFTFGAAAS